MRKNEKKEEIGRVEMEEGIRQKRGGDQRVGNKRMEREKEGWMRERIDY